MTEYFMLTVPHSEPPEDLEEVVIEHKFDLVAKRFAEMLSENLLLMGENVIVVEAMENRGIVDMNRVESSDTDFHRFLDDLLSSGKVLMLIDVHSFPDRISKYGDCDFAFVDYLDERRNRNEALASRVYDFVTEALSSEFDIYIHYEPRERLYIKDCYSGYVPVIVLEVNERHGERKMDIIARELSYVLVDVKESGWLDDWRGY